MAVFIEPKSVTFLPESFCNARTLPTVHIRNILILHAHFRCYYLKKLTV